MSLNYLADHVKYWNGKAGLDYKKLSSEVYSDNWWNKVQAQARVNLEEAQELYDAAFNRDPVELLDGVIDNFVTNSGLLAIIQSSNFNFDQAIDDVLENNDLKIFSTYSEAVEKLEELQEYDDSTIYSIEENYVYGVPSYCIKDNLGKIRKFKNFPRVNLNDYVPKQ